MVDKATSRIRFLIMEQLPSDGRHVDVEELELRVSSDAHSLNLCYSSNVFNKILTGLVEDQYVVNLSGRVIATTMGLVKSNIL